MKKILTILNKIPAGLKNNLMVIGLIFLVVWLVLPAFSIRGEKIFESAATRLSVFGLILLAYSFRFIFSAFQKHHHRVFSVFFCCLKENRKKLAGKIVWLFDGLNHYFSDFRRRLKKDQHRRHLKRMPWYIFLGDQQSGRKTFIKNMGLYYFKPEHFGDEAVHIVNQFPDFNWWFSEKAVLIDVMTHRAETEMVIWKNFIKFLKRERKYKPLSGVVLLFSLSDLLLYSNKTRQDFLQNMSNYLRDLHHHFNVKVPLYIIFNKADLVEGFMEFFNDLSKEELGQIWGMTFPIESCSNLQSVLVHFMREYDILMQKLRQRVMWGLDTERSLRGRELIYAFPQQMQLFKRPIENFISELFGSVRYRHAFLLRGFYFVSCDQKNGEKRDFLLQAMSKKFQLVPPVFKRISRAGECYFLARLFDEVIFCESVFLGDSEKRKKISKYFQRAVLLGCPIFLILMSIGFYQGCRDNLGHLSNVHELLQSYQSAIHQSMNEGGRFDSVLTGLNRLESAAKLYNESAGWHSKLLAATYFLSHAVYRALNRTLQSYFLPRAAAQIEKILNQNISNSDFLYAALKGYLAFSVMSRTSELAVKASMAAIWSKHFHDYSKKNKRLQHYLAQALKNRIPKLPVNHYLIDRIRRELQSVVPTERAYGLLVLRSKISGIPPLFISAICGSHFKTIFDNEKAASFIPALYTKKGFEKDFLSSYKEIATEVARDNQDIGLTDEEDDTRNAKDITAQMQRDYERHYAQVWRNVLQHIRFRPFRNLKAGISTLSVLTSRQSPLVKLLHLVYDNTSAVKTDHIHVSSQFKRLNRYIMEKQDDSSWRQTEKTLKAIQTVLFKLNNAPDSNKASFLLLKQWIQSDQTNPIADLHFSADSMPPPLKCWLNELANNCWLIIAQNAHHYMNRAWQKDVISVYDKSIRGRYPACSKSSSPIAIADFNRFFNGDGVLMHYFNQYIKPFVNNEKPDWPLYRKAGFSINLTKASIRLFQRAAVIRQYYFSGDSKDAILDFKMKPLSLDSRTRNISISLGDRRLLYSHGPQTMMSFHWPPEQDERAAVFIRDFNNRSFGKYFNGVWGWFRLLNTGVLRPEKTPGLYTLSFNFGGFHASYRLVGINQAAVFKLSALKGFVLPKLVADDVNRL